jgi:S1-C subfamily serine protease
MKRNLWVITALLVLAISVAGCSTQASTSSTAASNQSVTTTSTYPISVPAYFSGKKTFFEPIYAKVNPSVVFIQVVHPQSSSNSGVETSGSGFVWDTQGDIVTDNNLINGAFSITVTFTDGTVVDAYLVGTDADDDLAVIKVNPNGLKLQPATLADSTAAKVGNLAMAIGNPFGLENTMSVGSISAIGPATLTNTKYPIPDYIQFDTLIYSGSLGGVLLDDTGAVLGVTQSTATSSGSSSGVTLAFPSSIIKQVVPALITTGHYDHPALGVSFASLDPNIANAMNLPSEQLGALVEAVTSGGPADKAGIKASSTNFTDDGEQITIGGDVITAYNGQTVKSSDDLIGFVYNSGSVGQIVTLTVLRNGQQIQVQVTLGIRPSS